MIEVSNLAKITYNSVHTATIKVNVENISQVVCLSQSVQPLTK
jgi:hypothetical protein